jgi:hypothetical protein
MNSYLPGAIDDLLRVATLVVALYAALKVKKVEVSINHRMDQLIEKTEIASEAKGAADERANPLSPSN